MHQFLPYAWFGGRCVPFEQATVSVATHALHYGTGAFGGMRAIPNPNDGNEILLFRADRHARRLSQSARLLMAELPEETIHEAIHAFLRANRPTCPIYLRPFVYTSDLGIAPRLHEFPDIGPDTMLPIVERPSDFLVCVAGGPSLHSTYIPSFGGGEPYAARVRLRT